MKRFLSAIIFLLIFVSFLFTAGSSFAQGFNNPLNNNQNANQNNNQAGNQVVQTQPDGAWVNDSEVTFVGKAAARSGNFLDWALQNYNWAVTPGGSNPLTGFWATIRNISYAFLALFVLGAAFVLIITRGQNLSAKKLIPKFIGIILLITFSFAIIQFLYQIIDIIQGFFLKNPDPATVSAHPFISQLNLLNIAFDYTNFTGYRLAGSTFDESAFVSLLLVKLTAVTYYAMTGILLLRKIILWFFVVIAPMFPLLLLFYPIRNTAKIWIGEFFRWLLYAPLFAIFLSGLVSIWRVFIPMNFNFSAAGNAGGVVYPTSINILLGGPGQVLSMTNSVNYTDTFAQYVVALLMLWVVILLPFILLQIFLDYLSSFSFNESSFIKQILNTSSAFMNKTGPSSPTPPSSPPGLLAPAGMAKALPFANKFSIPTMKSNQVQNVNQFQNVKQFQDIKSVQSASQVLKLTNLSTPTMRDIVKYETNMLSSNIQKHEEVAKVHETLEKIANPSVISVSGEREHYSSVRQELLVEKEKGNQAASAVLTAAGTVITGPQKGQVAVGQKPTSFPPINHVQTVSLEDYEAVRKMWRENYQNMDVPKGPEGKDRDRKEWVKQDMDKISETINLLTSQDKQKVSQGMNMVAKILPFLLIGGFSQTEVIAYLKAKLEAGKTVLSEIDKKEEEEATTIEVGEKKAEQPKEMQAQQEVSDPTAKNP
ncbi:MAG: hypothetical protein Q8P80_00465 [Candidatus Levybacteria bacterium]|nr:hypothetical protein [Candidatus Levybacteria bacterium]